MAETPQTRTTVTLRYKRDLYRAQVGLAVISMGKRGKVDLYGTFKYNLSVMRGKVDRAIEHLSDARKQLRDEGARRDGKNNILTAQTNEKDPNATQVLLKDPMEFEKLETELLEQPITLSFSVSKLRLEDVRALDFSEQQGDYSGALPFIEGAEDVDEIDEPKTAAPAAAAEPARAEA